MYRTNRHREAWILLPRLLWLKGLWLQFLTLLLHKRTVASSLARLVAVYVVYILCHSVLTSYGTAELKHAAVFETCTWKRLSTE